MSEFNPFYNRDYTCPICNTNFSSFSVRSSATYVETRESDLHTIYKGVSPLHYSIIVCPTCHYAGSNMFFTAEVPPQIGEQIGIALFKLKSNDDDSYYSRERDLDTALKSFQLAIRSAQLRKVSSGELAGLLLGAAWMARENNESELENAYTTEALNQYLNAFNNNFNCIGKLNDLQATYLIGELYRRTGKYPEAVTWFNKVIFHNKIKTNPNIEKMAREQWAIAREEVKYTKNFATDDESDKKTNNENLPVPPVKSEQNTSNPTNHKRMTMQMSANLYDDQIKWLTGIVNNAYSSTRTLVTKEQVLRALLDAVMNVLDTDMPDNINSEENLKSTFTDLLLERSNN